MVKDYIYDYFSRHYLRNEFQNPFYVNHLQPVASPSATRQGGANPQLEYIDPTFVNQPGTPRSARTPSPRTGPVAEPVNSFPSPSKVNYAVINEKATKVSVFLWNGWKVRGEGVKWSLGDF